MTSGPRIYTNRELHCLVFNSKSFSMLLRVSQACRVMGYWLIWSSQQGKINICQRQTHNRGVGYSTKSYSQLPPYGHLAMTDSSKTPCESYRRLTEINFRYYRLSLVRTYGRFIRSQRHTFIVFSLVIADTEQHLGIFAHISSLFWSISASSVHQSKFLHLSLLRPSLQSRCHE